MKHRDSVWLFDVDGTLIGSVRSNCLRPGAETLIRTLHEQEKTLVLWSAGGAEYARRMMEQFGLDRFFSAFYAKQERGKDGRYRLDHLLPQHQPDTIVDDYCGDVPVADRVIEVSQFLGSNQHDKGLEEALQMAGLQGVGS